MIEVRHVSKEFVSPKKYPGLKVGVGDITGVLSNFHGNDEECDNTDIN